MFGKFTFVISIFCFVILSIFLISCQDNQLSQADVEKIAATYAEARNSGDLDLLDKIYAEDVISYDPSRPSGVKGLQALKEYYLANQNAMPDLFFTFDNVMASGDRGIFMFTITATHTGETGGVKPTGRKVNMTGVAVSIIKDGKIIEDRVYFNLLDLYLPMGFTLTPPRG